MIVLIVYLVSFLVKTLYLIKMGEIEKYIDHGEISKYALFYFCVNALGILMPNYTVIVIQLSKYRRNIKTITEAKNEQ